MYPSRDEARSDLLLSAAAYLFGPLFVGLFLTVVPLQRVPGVAGVLAIVLPLVFTVLVPLLLIRYRRESLREYGFGDGSDPSALTGLVAGLPIVAAGVVVALVSRGDPLAALPMFPAGSSPLRLASASPILVTAERLAQWVGVLLLALYVSVKARDAFGTAPVDTAEAVRKVGLVIVIAAVVATALLTLLTLGTAGVGRLVAVALAPLAVAGALGVVLQRAGTAGSTMLPAIVVPVVVLAIGPFRFTLQAAHFVNGVYGAALHAAMGLAVALLVQQTRRGLGVVMLALVIATLSMLGPFGFPG